MTRISYLDYSADEPERAIKFYNTVFGWQIKKWEGPFEYWEFKTGEPNEPGIDRGLADKAYTVNYFAEETETLLTISCM